VLNASILMTSEFKMGNDGESQSSDLTLSNLDQRLTLKPIELKGGIHTYVVVVAYICREIALIGNFESHARMYLFGILRAWYIHDCTCMYIYMISHVGLMNRFVFKLGGHFPTAKKWIF
jgi:hypothetical protein